MLSIHITYLFSYFSFVVRLYWDMATYLVGTSSKCFFGLLERIFEPIYCIWMLLNYQASHDQCILLRLTQDYGSFMV